MVYLALKTHTIVSWVMILCRLVHNYKYFRATYYLHLQCGCDRTSLKNSIKLPHHMSQTRRPQYEIETVLNCIILDLSDYLFIDGSIKYRQFYYMNNYQLLTRDFAPVSYLVKVKVLPLTGY